MTGFLPQDVRPNGTRTYKLGTPLFIGQSPEMTTKFRPVEWNSKPGNK